MKKIAYVLFYIAMFIISCDFLFLMGDVLYAMYKGLESGIMSGIPASAGQLILLSLLLFFVSIITLLIGYGDNYVESINENDHITDDDLYSKPELHFKQQEKLDMNHPVKVIKLHKKELL